MPEQNIPPQIKKMAFSKEIYKETERISGVFGLHIDQMGELDAEIRDIFLGRVKSVDFVDHISKRLEVSKETALKIGEEVNKSIFQAIKSDLQTQTASATLSSLEQAGGFTVETHPEEAPVQTETPSEVIKNIENPVPAQPRTDTTLVDHLLSGPVVAVEQKVEQKPQPAPVPKPQAAPQKPAGPDPYREAI
jgi:hypothetical protein